VLKTYLNFLLIFLLLISADIHAQSKLDSLELLDPIHDFDAIRRIIREGFSEQNDPILQRINTLEKNLAEVIPVTDSLTIIKAKSDLADLYISKQQYNEGINLYIEVLKDHEAMGNKVQIARISLKLGTLYRYADRPMPSKESYEELKKVFIEYNDADGLAYTIYNLGILEQDPDKKEAYFKEALAIQKKLVEQYPNEKIYLQHYSQFLNANGRYLEALEVSKKINSHIFSIFYLNNLGDEERLKANYDKALYYFNQSLDLSKEHRLQLMLRNTYINFARVYWLKGEFEKAFLYENLSFYLMEQGFAAQNENELTAYRAKFENELAETENRLLKKDLLIKELTLEQKSQQNIFLGIGFLLSAALLSIIYLSRLKIKEALSNLEISNRLISKQRDELITTESRLKEAQKIAQTGNFEIILASGIGSYSDECKAILELSASDVLKDFREVISTKIDTSENLFKEYFFSDLYIDAESVESEFNFFSSTGNPKWLNIKLQKKQHESGNILVFGTVQDITKRKKAQAAQIENIRNMRFTEELIESQESEKNRISAELHDGVGQEILLIKNYAELAIKSTQKKQHKSTDLLNLISENSSKLLESIRRIIYELRPVYLDKLGLTDTLLNTISTICDTNGITLETDITYIDKVLTKENEVHLYRIIQELSTNTAKYSGAKLVHFSTKNTSDFIEVSFIDFGIGFDYQKKAVFDTRPHFGLENIKHRSNLMKAELHFTSSKGSQTNCLLRIPKELAA